MPPLFEQLHFIDDPVPRAGALNMAIDEALCARGGATPILRVYRWSEASVSFGYFGRWREVAERWPGRAPVRRWTGGGEVAHGEDLTYTLVVPRGHPFCQGGVRDSYGAIHAALLPLLPGAALAAGDAPENAACFARPVVFDVVAAGAKIAGAAQRRTRQALLHQGSIQGVRLAEDFPAVLAGALGSEVRCEGLSPAVRSAARELAATKYGTREWLERA